ncbi:hypothetical protein [Aquibium microcysteis]|uniref:hypothetical protein n=1 Tax=Aquibium microcysteis TaxID=675281 RepID=UPI001AEE09EB|nr:hypothetical protein [Aquibium microcysteis]
MAKFEVLTGKALKAKVAGFGKRAATFSADMHQLAFSALQHVEDHHDPVYCTQLFQAMPTNYQASLKNWFTAFGKVTFNRDAMAFAYAKGKASDMAKAMDVSPAEFQRAKGAAKTTSALMDRVESLAKKAIEGADTSHEDKAFARALANFVQMYKAPAPVADKPAAPRVIKGGKGKAAPVAAMVETVEPVAQAA